MDSDNYYTWFVLAIVVISFIRWLIERVVGKKFGPEDSTIVEDKDVARRREEARRRQVGDVGDGLDPNAQIRQFFEQITGQTFEEPQPEPTVPSGYVEEWEPPRAEEPPPPLPSSPPEAHAPESADAYLTPEEKDALARIEEAGGGALITGPQRSRSAADSPIRRLLADREGLRNAILVREILGRPKGF